MHHSIKLEDEIYKKLDNFRGKKETYSQAVERLLNIEGQLDKIIVIIEDQIKHTNWQREQIHKAEEAVLP